MLLLDAIQKKTVAHTPVWLMRQAGRYMKEYRDLRAKVSFLELCKSPELVCETTVFACETINADAAIIFADILLITECLGFDLEFAKSHGPIIHNPLRAGTPAPYPDQINIESLNYVGEGLRLTRQALPKHKALIGFAGAPFTVATYCIEGGKSVNFDHVRTLMQSDPKAFQTLMTKLTDGTISYLRMQIEHGADVIQLFDSWISLLTPQEYETHVLPHMQRIFTSLKDVPTIYFGTKTKTLLPVMSKAGANVMGLDSDVHIDQIWPTLDYMPIQGNLHQDFLFEDFSVIQKEVDRILAEVGGKPGYIFNLGHGIKPQTPVDNVIRLIAYVHEKTQA